MQENEKSDPCSPPAMWVSLVWLEKCWSQTRLKAQPWLEAAETGKCGVICPSRLENFQSTHASDVHILLLVKAITLHPRALVLNHSVVLQEQMSWIIGNIFIIYLLLGCRKCFLIGFFLMFHYTYGRKGNVFWGVHAFKCTYSYLRALSEWTLLAK